MLKIRFILLFGCLLGSALSFAAIKTREKSVNPPTVETKQGASTPDNDRKISQH